jgi:ribonuclease BN (tRNA processing enzyme)
VRGTIPSPGPDTQYFGANTPCIDLYTDDHQLIVLDAGTGIRPLGQQLLLDHPGRVVGTIFITHTHWDHIQGFPFFIPLQDRHNRFVVVGLRRIGQQLERVLEGQISEPYLPFAYSELEADIMVKEIGAGETMVVGDMTTVLAAELDHPGGCLGYRIDDGTAVLTYCTDTGHPENGLDKNVRMLAQNADLLVHDASFTLAERARYPGWGHSSWKEAAEVAASADVGLLALFHFSPNATDDQLHAMIADAREIFPRTILAREGMEISLPFKGNVLTESLR